MLKKTDPEFPNVKSLTRHFGSLRNIADRMAAWAASNPGYDDVATILPASDPSETVPSGA